MEPDSKVVRLLLVEDNSDHAFLIRRAIKQSGALIMLDHVLDGEEAMDYLYQRRLYERAMTPDLIFLDLNMPKMNGHEVLAQIKQDDKLKKIPVVILTTSDLSIDQTRALDLQANSYIVKPTSFKDFMDRIADMCQYWISVDIGLGRTVRELLDEEDQEEDCEQ